MSLLILLAKHYWKNKMKILSQEDTDLIATLANNEIVVIEKGFAISEFMGKVFLSNAINDFKNIHLKAKYGDIIPSMCTEYRLFIFKILENIKDEYRGLATKEVIVPTIGEFEKKDLLKALKL